MRSIHGAEVKVKHEVVTWALLIFNSSFASFDDIIVALMVCVEKNFSPLN